MPCSLSSLVSLRVVVGVGVAIVASCCGVVTTTLGTPRTGLLPSSCHVPDLLERLFEPFRGFYEPHPRGVTGAAFGTAPVSLAGPVSGLAGGPDRGSRRSGAQIVVGPVPVVVSLPTSAINSGNTLPTFLTRYSP